MDNRSTYNFKCRVFEASQAPEAVEIDFQNPVGIYCGMSQLGFASIEVDDNNEAWADCTIVYDCPERLDIQNQEAVYILPNVIFQRRWPYNGNLPSKMTIRRLEFHRDVEDIGLSKAWETHL